MYPNRGALQVQLRGQKSGPGHELHGKKRAARCVANSALPWRTTNLCRKKRGGTSLGLQKQRIRMPLQSWVFREVWGGLYFVAGVFVLSQIRYVHTGDKRHSWVFLSGGDIRPRRGWRGVCGRWRCVPRVWSICNNYYAACEQRANTTTTNTTTHTLLSRGSSRQNNLRLCTQHCREAGDAGHHARQSWCPDRMPDQHLDQTRLCQLGCVLHTEDRHAVRQRVGLHGILRHQII